MDHTEQLNPNTLRLLFLGDIVGEPGRKAVIQNLALIRERWRIDFVVANGENSAGGRGITAKICIDLLRAGVAVVTTGDHAWDQKEIVEYFDLEPRLLRPINYPAGTPGQGSVVLESKKGKIGVIQVQGRTFMQPPLDNPFLVLEREVARIREETPLIFVDAHAETTSEKIALARSVDGLVSAVVGTHTHVQTADERLLPEGTAFLCDAGMCGPEESCLGREIGPVLHRFRTGLPNKFPIASGEVRLCGAVIDIHPITGRALRIERFSRLCGLDGELKEK